MKTMTSTSRRTLLFRLRPAFNKTLALSGLLSVLLAAPAFADDVADVTKLLRAGQHAQALSKADAFLGKNPRDAQMRFLKGVILTEQNKSSEAIAIFTKLTEDFPALPEPYNNLAVLYAAAGQYDKAAAALEAAIRTSPSYATAYENLGDVHAKLASQAYDKALQLDSGNSTAKSKLTLVRSLVGNMTAPKTVEPALAAKAATPAPVVAQKPPVALPPVAAAPAQKKPAAAPAPKPAPAPVVAASKPEEPARHEPKPTPKADNERDDVLAAVHGWAKAWSAQDVKSYLNYYASDFRTPGGQARKAWEDERRSRIVGKGRISVEVESPQVSLNGNTATVKFRQIYLSDRLKANTRKTLTLEKHGGKWQIRQESTGS
jgi:tetratricopeptide (TPR) repeat protein